MGNPLASMSYETDQRLKNYLDTNQLSREQMCLAVLSIDKRFSDLLPRHPRGGPDGARDIEGKFNGFQRVFGAVGFVNQASDSSENKTAVSRKFSEDLTNALEQDLKPEVFVFLTNVNLTIGEKEDLVIEAKSKGLAHAEIFDRERLRIALDAADGFSIRYQYLNIPLSEAEQATFFARWGDDIQNLISNEFGSIQRTLYRIQFLQEATLPLEHLTILLKLDREYRGHEIGHFRAFAVLFLATPVEGLLSLMFGSTDNMYRPEAQTQADLSQGESGIAKGRCSGVWEMRFPETTSDKADVAHEDHDGLKYERVSSATSIGIDPIKIINIDCRNDGILRIRKTPRLIDIDNGSFVFFFNRALAEKIERIRVYGNEYLLTDITREFRIDDSPWESPVPYMFSPGELADPWVRLRPKAESRFTIRFSNMTPRRFFESEELPKQTGDD
jgi:hypothetical protein